MNDNLTESPCSDTKMDISETTTATGFTTQATSPSTPQSPRVQSPKPGDEGTPTTTTTSTSTLITNLMANERQQNELLDNQSQLMAALDNVDTSGDRDNQDDKQHKRSNVLRLGRNNSHHTVTNSTNAKSTSLTLANSHPLMSPPASSSSPNDSDPELSPRKVFNYPDVVPESEPLHRKIAVLRDPSPDFLSSGSEPDLSQYQATVAPHFQSVALVSTNNTCMVADVVRHNLPLKPSLQHRRKIPISSELLSDDVSSMESISNRSFNGDDDYDRNLVSLSPTSSVFDDAFDVKCNLMDDIDDLDTPMNDMIQEEPIHEQIAQYTAVDEARDARNWQKVTLPDGKTHEIDMKVIEPYKRVLSHGGYLKAQGHNAVVVFCACHLPDRSRADYHYVMNNLFLYVVKTLEQLVTEDYVLVYLHGGSSRGNVPPFPWLKKCYQLLDRRLRKSLKNLYMVHPTFWLKSVVWMTRPFVSSKFWRKLVYVRSLEELYTHVPVEKAAIPDKVKNYDSKYA